MRSSRMASLRTQARLGTTLQAQALFAGRGGERRLDAIEQMTDREFRDVRGQHAGIELGDVEQCLEELVHGSDGGIDAGDEPGALRRVGAVAKLRREQVQGVQRLAQIVACRRKKARLGEIGALDLTVALGQLAVAPARAMRSLSYSTKAVLDVAREVDEQKEGDDGRERNAPVQRIGSWP